MEQIVLVKDVIPYIQTWTFIIIVILIGFTYHIWRFGRRHPKTLKADTNAEDARKKSELRRHYRNISMLALSTIFLWIIGMAIIFLKFDSSASTGQSWFLLIFAVFAIAWLLSFIQRRPKK